MFALFQVACGFYLCQSFQIWRKKGPERSEKQESSRTGLLEGLVWVRQLDLEVKKNFFSYLQNFLPLVRLYLGDLCSAIPFSQSVHWFGNCHKKMMGLLGSSTSPALSCGLWCSPSEAHLFSQNSQGHSIYFHCNLFIYFVH